MPDNTASIPVIDERSDAVPSQMARLKAVLASGATGLEQFGVSGEARGERVTEAEILRSRGAAEGCVCVCGGGLYRLWRIDSPPV